MEKNLFSNFLINSLKGIPGYKFLNRMYYFIIKPEIIDGEWEASPLKYAGENLVHSLVLVASLVTLISLAVKGEKTADFIRIVNPFYLTLNLGLQAVVFGAIFWLIISSITSIRKKSLYPVYFMQVIQTYSVLNFLVVILFLIGMHWTLVNEVDQNNLSSYSIFIGGSIALCSFAMFIYLFVIPTARYLYSYFPKGVAWSIVLFSVILATAINQHVHVGFNGLIINRSEFCEYLFRIEYQNNPKIKSIKSCIIGKCVERDFKL